MTGIFHSGASPASTHSALSGLDGRPAVIGVPPGGRRPRVPEGHSLAFGRKREGRWLGSRNERPRWRLGHRHDFVAHTAVPADTLVAHTAVLDHTSSHTPLVDAALPADIAADTTFPSDTEEGWMRVDAWGPRRILFAGQRQRRSFPLVVDEPRVDQGQHHRADRLRRRVGGRPQRHCKEVGASPGGGGPDSSRLQLALPGMGVDGEVLMVSTYGTSLPGADRWQVRKVSAACLRAVIMAVPLPLSAGVGVLVGWSVGGSAPLDILVRVVAAGLASVAAYMVIEWLIRRLVPLAVLLRLSFVFPDRAPSRFSVALRSTSVRRLREWARSNQDRLDEQALAEKVLTLASALNFHDRRTRGHSERTRALAELVVEELGLSEAEANEVRWGAFLHDIGKLLVPSSILNKAGTPTAAEWEQLRQHPAEGGRLVRPLRPFIGSGVDAVSAHHEAFDGTGYPDGLRGEEIALAARIVSVVDSFEVMTAVRSYKRPMSAAAARQELVREAGKQFDPKVVRAFVNVSLGRLHWALGLLAWTAELPFIGIVPRAAAQVGATVGAGSSAVSTATLASVATASLGASLMVNPLAAPVPPAAAAAPPAATAVVPGATGAGSLGGESRGTSLTTSGVSKAPSSSSRAGSATGGKAVLAGPSTTGSGSSAGSASSASAPRGPVGTADGGVSTQASSTRDGSNAPAGATGTTDSQGASGTTGSGTNGGSGTTGSSSGTSPVITSSLGTLGTAGIGTSDGTGVPVVSTVLNDVGGVVTTTLGAVGKLGLLTLGKSGTSTSKGKSGLLGL